MIYFYEKDINGNLHPQRFNQKDAGCMFWFLFIVGFIIPIILFVILTNIGQL